MSRARLKVLPAIKRLPVSPAPREDEALASYVARVAWANGMERPRHLTQRLLGDREGGFRLNFKISRLAAATGRDASEFTPFEQDLTSWGGDRALWLVLLGGRLARPTKICRLCPICVYESGFVHRRFDLLSLTACPTHGCRVIDECPQCTDKLLWDRRSLVHCDCGCDLTTSGSVRYDLSSEEKALNDLLSNSSASKFEGCAEALNLPMNVLRSLTFDELLNFLLELAKLAAVGREEGAVGGADAIPLAIGILENWPHSFVSHIHKLFEGENRQIAYDALFGPYSLSRDHKRRPAHLSKTWRPFVMQELFNALVSGAPFYLHPTLVKRVFGERRWPWMATSTAAHSLGLSGRQLRFAERVGEVALVRTAALSRTVVEIDALDKPMRARIARRSMASVDDELGLPRGLFLSLVRGEAFGEPAVYTGKGITERAVARLLHVLERCAANQPRRLVEPPITMGVETVGSILRGSSFDRDAKVRLVSALVSGKFQAWRRRDGFFALEVASFPNMMLGRSKRRYIPGAGSVVDLGTAARHLQTITESVAALVQSGHLKDGGRRGRSRTVTIASLHRFSDQWVSTGHLCRLLSNFPARIICSRMARLAPNVRRLHVAGSSAYFYRRSDIGDAVSFVTRLLS